MKRRISRGLVVLALCLGPFFLATAQNIDPVGLRRAIEAQERHTDSILSVPGAFGTGVGVDARGQPVVKIYTEALGISGLPRTVDGVPVRIEVTGRITALRNRCSGPPLDRPDDCKDKGETTEDTIDPTARFDRPVPIGVSTGHIDITAGTICCRVTKNAPPQTFALSNNHVYADEGRATRGDNVLQPGPSDGGVNDADAIGTLEDFVEIMFLRSASNFVDAAIAELSSPISVGNATPADGYGVPKSSPITAAVGMRVIKYGRTTGQTRGTVDAINVIIFVGYDNGTARFVNQIAIRAGGFSKPGDSGSLVVVESGDDALAPVGLVFAGGRGLTFANQIGDVLSSLSISIDGDD